MNPFKLLSEVRSFWPGSLTLQKRLLAFFLLFLMAVMAGLFLLLIAAGVFTAGMKESRAFLENELTHVAEDISTDCGIISVEGVAISKRLTEQIEESLKEQKLSPAEMQDSPECLNSILHSCLEILYGALEKNKVSGAFLILDATVNPVLENAAFSRAGLFLKNMEPNAANRSESSIRYMRGPAHISRQNGLTVLPQWQMEFAVTEGDFFHTVIDTAKGSNLPLSRLYYWNPKSILQNDYQEAILLTVPLVARDGTILGACGFEISAMLFKLQNSPDNSVHTRVFSMLSPYNDETFDISGALFAGSCLASPKDLSGSMGLKAHGKGLYSFTTSTGGVYAGLYKPINLYPKDSAHAGNGWAVAVMIPEQDFSDYVAAQNSFILILLVLLLTFSVAAAALLSRRYITPVVEALKQMQQKDATNFKKTNIQEIDDLFEFLAAQDQSEPIKPGPIVSKAHTTGLFEAFVENIGSLSPAERAVFNLYMEGHTAKEIADILYLSINTIKTHNKRIYIKLNVASRKELMVYLNMLKEKGETIIAD
ncbi:MAG: helix-turn-helix transcriptional regulator [Syntrophomonadaceae bacterium]|nr:helix-turn-helix transcriptional regulator [Syntrophomonadaceae bacterium]